MKWTMLSFRCVHSASSCAFVYVLLGSDIPPGLLFILQVPPLLMRHGDGLSALNMNDNALKTLPQTFAEIKNLRYLSLDNNLLQ